MSAVTDLLSECSAAGVKLFLDKGRLRYRAQPGAYTEDLRQRVAVHRDAVVAALASRPVTLDLTREAHRQEALTTVKLGESVYRETADNGAGRIGARESMASDLEAPQGGATATPTSPIKHARRRALASTPPPHIGPITDGQQGPLSFLYSVLRDGVGREESLSARASGASQRPLSS
jgi:hypothetical protein